MNHLRSTRTRRIGGWLLGGLVAGLAVMPICDLHFDCGCTWPGMGDWKHCDIHTAGPPDCPWCDHIWTFALAMVVSYGAALAAVWRVPERTHVGLLALVSLAVVLLLTLLAGVVTSLLTGRELLLGL